MSCAATKRRRADCAQGQAAAPDSTPEMVDVVFDIVAGDALPPAFEWPLYQAVARLAHWIEDCAYAGIHPMRGVCAADGGLLLSRRAKLIVRMPRDRVCASSVLERAVLEVGAARLQLGQGTFRKLRPAPTVYSPRVSVDAKDEATFARRLAAQLERLDIRRPFICGRRTDVALGSRAHTAFSVAVHDLDEAQSLLLQRAGLGEAHCVGCGLFVPHRTITAPA